jgi:hypothetical protein
MTFIDLLLAFRPGRPEMSGAGKPPVAPSAGGHYPIGRILRLFSPNHPQFLGERGRLDRIRRRPADGILCPSRITF